jgi:hypothetical protein
MHGPTCTFGANLTPFSLKVLAAHHGVPEDAAHKSDWSLDKVEGLPADKVLDMGGEVIVMLPCLFFTDNH